MEERRLGASGLTISRLGLGTMTWGTATDVDDASAQLRAFRDAGGTFLDTADVYADGASERVVGQLLRDVVPRDEVVVATKAYGRTGPGGMGRGSSRGHLLAALDASLARLDLDYVDLWQLHAFDTETPLEETLTALDTAVASGRTRYVGVSNFCGWQTAYAAAWQRALGHAGRTPLVSNQVEYSLLQRGVEREVVPAAAHAGIGLLPWSPLGRGVLTGKYRHSRPSDSRAASTHLARFVEPFLPSTPAGWSRRSRRPPTGWAPARWPSPWPGCGTSPGWWRRSSAPAPRPSWPSRSPVRRSTCRMRSRPPWTTCPRRPSAIPNAGNACATRVSPGCPPDGFSPDRVRPQGLARSSGVPDGPRISIAVIWPTCSEVGLSSFESEPGLALHQPMVCQRESAPLTASA